jgi:hypothetical protein
MKIFIHYLNKCTLIQFNKKYHKLLTYFILRGHDMLTNIFLALLNKSKTIDIIFIKCQQACEFYIEFIEQISHEQNICLNLTSRDAVMYVYKQSILDDTEINNDIHFNHMFQPIYLHANVCKKILENYLKHKHIDVKNITEIAILCEKIFNAEWNTLNIEIIETLLDMFYCADLNPQSFYDIFSSILKKHPSVLSNIKKNILKEDILPEIHNMPNHIFVDWICN